MKTMLGLGLAGLVGICLLNGCNSEAPKIGVVDMNRVISESQEGKRANTELDSLVKEKRAEAEKKAEEIAKLRKDLENTPAGPRKSKEDDMNRLTVEYKKAVAAYEGEVRQKAADLRAGLVKEIKSILESVGSEGKYALILSAENAPFFQKTIDITDKVITRYNELQGTR